MLRTVRIVPALLTADPVDYRTQIEKLNAFARRIQIDVCDGMFVQNQTLDLNNVWWPKTWQADLHLMVSNPSAYLDTILKLHPSLVILHAEADEDLLPLFAKLRENGIKPGLCFMRQTYPGRFRHYIDAVDHVLVFAGTLGQQGGRADLMQTEKIPLIRNMKPELEIGWDGGANLNNLRILAHSDLDIINVGSALSKAPDPTAMYQALVAEIDKNGVVI